MRWDGDERGDGVADATRFANGAAELLAAMQRPNWVAEQPELHLLPHLERACESLPFELLEARSSDDDVYGVRLAWTGGEVGIGAIRAKVFALLGAISEPATYVRQRRTERNTTLMFEVVPASSTRCRSTRTDTPCGSAFPLACVRLPRWRPSPRS